MTKEQIKKALKEKPSYIRERQYKKFSIRYNVPVEDVKEAVKEVREETQDYNLSEFQSFLESNKLKITDVKKVKFWQNFKGEHRFSVDTKSEWYNNPEDLLGDFREALSEYTLPTHNPVVKKGKGESIAVINLYDAHIDKIVLIDETNPSGSVEDNCELFEDAFNKLLSQSLVYNPEMIIFPVGNDFFNANDSRNTTVRGTPQDSNPFWKKSFMEGYKTIRRCIDKAANYCSVYVVMVMSNHDADKLFYLGQMLQATYEKDGAVFIDDTTKSRKYITYGSNLIGFSHGDKEKNYIKDLPATIMIENKNMMPEIDYIHHFCGDVHHKETFQSRTSHDLRGCTISFLRALSEISKWEYEQGYVGGHKTAESYIFTKDKGLAANLLVHI